MAMTKHERRLQRKLQRQREDQGQLHHKTEAERSRGRVDGEAHGGAAQETEADDVAVHGGDAGCCGDVACDLDDGRGVAVGDERKAQGGAESVDDEAQLEAMDVEREAKGGGETWEVMAEYYDGDDDAVAATSGVLVCGDIQGSGVARDEDAKMNQAPSVVMKAITGPSSRISASVVVYDDGSEADVDDAGQEPASHSAESLLSDVTISTEDSLLPSLSEVQLRGAIFTASISDLEPAVAPPGDGEKQLENPNNLSLSCTQKSKIEQLERDIRFLVQEKTAAKSRPQRFMTPGETVSSSRAPSDSPSTDAAESVDADQHGIRGGVYDDKQEARILQLEAQLAWALRKAEVLEAEALAWTEAASMNQDFRSQLLEAQVEKRALAEKLRRIVQDERELEGGSQAAIAELQNLVSGLCRPRTLRSNQPSAVAFSDSLVFQANQKTGRGGKTTKAWSCLWGDQNPSKEQYAMSIMRLCEVPLKRQRDGHSGSDTHIKSSLPRHLDHQEVAEQLHSPPQLKRSRIEDVDSDSSDEEEFLCHVDPTGKVTALGVEDTNTQDVFLAVSM